MKWFTQLKLLAANQRSDLPGVDMETYPHTNSIANRCYATLGSPTHIGDSLARDGMNSSRQTLIMNCRFQLCGIVYSEVDLRKILLKFEMQSPDAFMSRCGATCTASASAHRKSHPAACSTHNTFSAALQIRRVTSNISL